MAVILIPDFELDRDGYIFGFDPPTTANLGYAVFHYTHSSSTAEYCESGSHHIHGGDSDRDRIMNLKEYLEDLVKQYNPPVIFSLERAIGRGFPVAREQLGENTGVMKSVGYASGANVVAIHTSHMTRALFGNEKIAKAVNKKRKKKKKALCQAVKAMFPEHLADRRVSQSGVFTHEADAITFVVAICNLLNVDIPEIKNGWLADAGFLVDGEI